MLQQTTVAAVVPYFERFIAAFPDVHALAGATEQDVLKLWAGLGYYRRARHLYAAAQQLVRHHQGQLPDDPAVWQALPGVGRYILGAVLSQAFDQRQPIVEANSLRVLTRVFGYRGDPRSGPGQKWLWATAEAILPHQRCGDFNQALMELGSLVCTPTTPHCGRCPLAGICQARQLGLQDQIPPKKNPPPITAVTEVGVIIWKKGRLLLCQRPSTAPRWPNLWEVPHAEKRPEEDAPTAAVRIAQQLTGYRIEPLTELITLKHGVTRFAITLVGFEAQYTSGRFRRGPYAQAQWVQPHAWTDYPVSSPQRKLLTALVNSCRQRRLF
ncbi:MAG: NUDIX domain-containing protein [Gemmataceae bacterium]|nr:NUDIX domain-containing protein [Gemmata sp.]MDW8197127.1 NUDIX domain-containing protein [Gemmataceae bacterium]